MIRFNQLISVLMVIFVLLGCSDQQQGIQEDPSLMENEIIQPKNIEIVDDYLADPQFDMTFPVDTSDDNYNSRILPSLLTNFIHFEDQGEILVTPINVDHFDLYINGYRLEIEEDSWQDGKIHKVDISPYTINGKNTIQVSNIQGEDSSVNVQIAYPKVVDGKDLYATNDTFSLIDSIIEAEVENGFTSAQLTIIKDGKIAKNSSYGYVNNYESDGTPLKENDKVKVTNDSLFDLASNTKMYATNYAIQQLVSNGDLLIDDPVSNYFPEFKDDESADIVGKDKIKIRDLLMHQAGFPADPQYHNNNFDEIAVAEDGSNALFAQDKETTKEMILQTPLVYEPGTETIYSDVDYMLLGLIVEEVSGKSLDEYVKQYFFDPLKLTQITFNPLENGFEKDQIVATELKGNTRDGVVDFDHIRTEIIQGEVHDEKAFYAMDGVSGHAGLFSNSEDLAILAQVMLNGGGYEDNKFFDQKTIDEFTKPSPIDDTFGLGWRRQGA
ncbi:penicillin binding protein PBP4B [Amphibacillus sp. MSJ-3]|nr:penicillin binding protein PBP4B [Amphibacillus sp. MSJ-3]MBU5595674.1 penicillin binding protein PBP4B [Amphibacillus sp. MSJ-3]